MTFLFGVTLRDGDWWVEAKTHERLDRDFPWHDLATVVEVVSITPDGRTGEALPAINLSVEELTRVVEAAGDELMWIDAERRAS